MHNSGDTEQSGVLHPGTLVLERYRIETLLGTGGTGYVILATDTEIDNADVVLKLLYPHLISNRSSYRRFKDETSIAFELSHPCIVQTFGFEVWPAVGCFISMEYMAGGSLRDVAESKTTKRLSYEELIRHLHAVLLGLSYAHQRGVVHCDIKPQNLLLSSDRQVKIADFGISQMGHTGHQNNQVGDLAGTPYYMPPEQFEGRLLDERADLYSLGISFFELACGKLPFQASTLFELASQHLSKPLPQLNNVGGSTPPWFQGFLERCCAKSPEDRFLSAGEAFEELKAHAQDLGINQNLPSHTMPIDRRVNLVEMERSMTSQINRRLFIISLLVIFSIAILVPRAHIPLRRRYATVLLLIERHTNLTLSAVKDLFLIDVTWGDHSQFFDKSNDRVKLFPLLEAGMDPNFYWSKILFGERVRTTPLHFWCTHQSKLTLRTIRKLIDHGANINALDSNSETPLHMCVKNYWADCAELLLSRGADSNIPNSWGNTPLHIAISARRKNLAKLLLTAGAKADVPNHEGLTAHMLAEKYSEESPETREILQLFEGDYE